MMKNVSLLVKNMVSRLLVLVLLAMTVLIPTPARAALAAAQAGDSASACGMLGAFINEVQAQSGHAITTEQATELINLANQVRAGLACP